MTTTRTTSIYIVAADGEHRAAVHIIDAGPLTYVEDAGQALADEFATIWGQETTAYTQKEWDALPTSAKGPPSTKAEKAVPKPAEPVAKPSQEPAKPAKRKVQHRAKPVAKPVAVPEPPALEDEVF